MNTPARDQIERNRALSPVLMVIGLANIFVLALTLSGVGVYIDGTKPIRIGQLACGVGLLFVGIRDWWALFCNESEE